MIRLLAGLAAATALAGPVEFGMAEVQRAIAERGLKPGQIRFNTDISTDPPETYRIIPGRISGGDVRGLMYGLLEAAEQIRANGRLVSAKGTPATPMRGIRWFLHNRDLEQGWYYSREYWRDFFEMLARNRFNRFNLVFAHQTEYLAPPYPFWFSLREFPSIQPQGVSPFEIGRNLEMLQFISHTAAEYAVDFTLGIWEHNIQTGMKPSVDGITDDNIGPYSYAALKRVLAECPLIRSVQMRTNAESGIPNERQVAFYRDWVYRALREAGRRVTLDLRGWAMRPDMLRAATESGVPVRLSCKYWAEDLGRPYQPAETFPGYSYLNFLERTGNEGGRAYDFYWELWGLGSHRLLLWGDPEYVRRAVPTFLFSGSMGFEIDPPLAQKGFGNAPGNWSVFTEQHKDRVFWRHEFERYWLFYLLWGRLSYDPKTPDKVWTRELERRFGAAAASVMDAYQAASGVLNEIVATHLADPNMYVWPEVNPGGLIEAYREVRPSDWRFVATVQEAVRNRIRGDASAKQTPVETSGRLHAMARRTNEALARARKSIAAPTPEWRSSETDFEVLASLAEYHARKQMASDQLTWFYETGDSTGLYTAQRELRGALRTWQALVKLTDGLYPDAMAFGPDDTGHWKDKLPWVEHDLKLLDERVLIWDRFGHFRFGFDFGAGVEPPRGALWRSDPYLWQNTVEPRFQLVDPRTIYSEDSGFGWTGPGEREAVRMEPAPYRSLRASEIKPARLPSNALYGDAIRGRGSQTFRVRTGDGKFTVHVLKPDGSSNEESRQAGGGLLDIVMHESEWVLSGIIIHGGPERPPPAPRWPESRPRPQIEHTPPKTATAGQPLSLNLRISPVSRIRSVRLHYRPVNQLAKFKTLDAAPQKPAFTVPAEDVSARWDLMYYFEILHDGFGGWFEPNPDVATPYYVVKVESSREPQP